MRSDRISSTKAEISKQFPVDKRPHIIEKL